MDKNIKLPTKISPPAVVEAVVSLQFQPDPPPDAVFGLVYNLLPDHYKNVENLPILQLPDQIRQNDRNLTFQPYYRMKYDAFILQLGPRVWSLATQNYPGWSAFSTEILSILSKIISIPLFKQLLRIGLRYINLFDQNVFTFSKLSLTVVNRPLADYNTLLRTELNNEPFITRLQVANRATLTLKDKPISGSVIDLDTFVYNPLLGAEPIADIKQFLDSGHAVLKECFFSLLKEDFLKSLNPEYD